MSLSTTQSPAAKGDPAGASPPPLPGLVIAALAVAAGVHPCDAALGLAAVMGGIAGPLAGPQSVVGDLVDPGFHLVAAASHSGSWQRLEELLFQPIIASQRRLRDLSRLTSSARLDHLRFSRFADKTDEIVELTKPGMYRDPGIPTPPDYPERHIAAFCTPTFFLRAPDELTWNRAKPEILDACALVWDGGSVLKPLRESRSTSSPTRELLAAATGCDRFVERDKQVGPGRLDLVKAYLFVSTSRDEVSDALAFGGPGLRTLLESCVLALPSCDPCPITLNPASIRAGYEGYRAAVDKVLGTRRSGGGFRLAFKDELSEQLEQSITRTRHWCTGLPPQLQPHFAHTVSLVHRLAWTFLATLCPGENDRWVEPFVRATVQHVRIKQKEFLEEQMFAAEVARQQHARQVMLEKLAAIGPCPLRGLLRRYSVQKRELHQPVLDALMNEGLIRRRDDGWLELTAGSDAKT